jgi:hypothetical protein
MNDWSVELWDVPARLADGWSSRTLFMLAAAALVLAGAAFDRRRTFAQGTRKTWPLEGLSHERPTIRSAASY